jgi:hypothetical protein
MLAMMATLLPQAKRDLDHWSPSIAWPSGSQNAQTMFGSSPVVNVTHSPPD